MAVRYIQVQSISALFAPAVRAYGNIAIIGNATTIGATPSAQLFTSPPAIPQGKTAGIWKAHLQPRSTSRPDRLSSMGYL